MAGWNMTQQELDEACLESNKIGKLIFNIKERKTERKRTVNVNVQNWEIIGLIALVLALSGSLTWIVKR